MAINIILLFVSAATSVLLAGFVALRQPRSLAKGTLLPALLLVAAENLFAGLGLAADTASAYIRWHIVRLAFMGFVPLAWLAFSLTYGRGDARAFLRKWRPALLVLALAPPLVLSVLHARLIALVVDDGTPAVWHLRLGQGGILLHTAVVFGMVGVLMNLERTLKAATGTMRWRVKFMILGVGIFAATRIYFSTQALLYSAVGAAPAGLGAGVLLVSQALIFWSLRRSALSTVDLYPSHSVIYHSLSAVVAGVYLLGIGLLAQLATYLGDVGSFPLRAFMLFIGVVALTAVLLSDRARLLTKRFVSRHFHRPEYDYRRVWEHFTRTTAFVTDTRGFCRAASRMVSETFEVLSVTIWLLDEARGCLVFGESTSLGEAPARDLLAEPGASGEPLADTLRQLEGPLDIEPRTEAWALELKRCNPVHFEGRGGHRLCVPLKAGRDPLGVMLLGDRVRGVPYTTEEFDLLQTLGGQIAANLLTIQLSERLLHAKQLEAFQAMSAFFVHDLKNTSSTLSLTLQNLPKHFADPSFREDALKAIGRSVDKINELIRRLSMLRQKLEIHPASTDLNRLVETCLSGLPEPARSKVAFSPDSVPTVAADAEQLQKVLLNLVLNAHEATADDGRIEVAIASRPGWAVLSVRDNGAGMPPDFIEHSLFHPFKSTKKEGLGIGLFHSRMIVEAHRGRIEVTSAPGQGSTFRVHLPATRKENA